SGRGARTPGRRSNLRGAWSWSLSGLQRCEVGGDALQVGLGQAQARHPDETVERLRVLDVGVDVVGLQAVAGVEELRPGDSARAALVLVAGDAAAELAEGQL